MYLIDLDIKNLTVVRDKYNHEVDGVSHGRAIYRDDKYYYKIFHPDYVRLPYFRQAIEAGFYDELLPTPIEFILNALDQPVGYISEVGEVLSADENDTQLIPVSFLKQLEKAMLKTSMIYYDIVPSNIIKLKGELNIIDLESVYPVDKIHEMHGHNAIMKPKVFLENIISKIQPIKNIIFIPNIHVGNGRSNSYDLAVDSWKRWADANNTDVLVMEDLIHPIEDMKITWQRYMLFEMLENSGVKYDKILMADADMVIQPHTPNFFNMTDGKYVGVQANGCYEWLNRSIAGYKELFWPGITVHPWEYINGGFQIVNPSHKPFFEAVTKFYWDNQPMLLRAQNELVRASTDQTPINFLLKQHKIDVKLLSEAFNLQDPCRKTLLKTDSRQWWSDDLENLKKSAYIIHFNAIQDGNLKRDMNYWIERLYNELFKT
jgi:hypothetical protein